MLFEGLPADTVMGDGHKKGLAWGTLLRDGAQERHAEGGNGKYQASHKGSRDNTGFPGETEG